MNFGIVILALLLVGGTVVGLYSIMNSTNGVFVDTFGNTTSLQTNMTYNNLTNATRAVGGSGGMGVGFLLAITLIFVGGVYIARAVSRQGGRGFAR